MLFSMSVRASLVKCYEFNLYAWNEKNADAATFWISTLRGICEDLIVLNYVQGIPARQRDELMSGILRFELDVGLKTQSEFFRQCRPYQQVLGRPVATEENNQTAADIRRIWQEHGWPKMNRGVLPPIRQIAEKKGGDVLVALYDYLYRLTSRTVHFHVSGLLKSGWGDLPDVSFSPKNFSGYYTQFGRIYGVYIFCAYFELLARILRTDEHTKALINQLRSELIGTPRWPEIVTFEELNLERPEFNALQILATVMDAEKKKRLLRLG